MSHIHAYEWANESARELAGIAVQKAHDGEAAAAAAFASAAQAHATLALAEATLIAAEKD